MKSLFLHIGIAKAGSTTIQTFLSENRQALLAHGCLYPRGLGPGTQARLALFASPAFFEKQQRGRQNRLPASHKDFAEALERKVLEQVSQHSGHTVVLSSEHLSTNLHTAKHLSVLAALLRKFAEQIKIIVYVRRQDELLVSRYEQSIKAGNSSPLRIPPRSQGDHLYDYRVLTDLWAAEFGESNIIVRPLERQQFSEGRLEWDFLRCLDVSDRAGFNLVVDRNKSMGSEVVEFMRRLNPYLNSRQLQISVMRALSSQPKGGGVSIETEKLIEFYKRFEESNSFVARHYLKDSEGRLFKREPVLGGDSSPAGSDILGLDRAIEFAGAAISNLQTGSAVMRKPARARKPRRTSEGVVKS